MEDPSELENDAPDDAPNDAPDDAPNEADKPTGQRSAVREWRTPIILFVLTSLSTLWVGAQMEGVADPSIRTLWQGWTFAVPLMTILVSHEMGHYVAGRLHRVDTSPPYFIP